ncbi:hypothetical protein MPTK1_2g09150 [Marchantia polymorpha subsp. ruderalis]|uniref:Phosphatidic acid phosphatase type 2/haloperoxidase domain-containing protein n=2 Tax=Marchantia polymorpha TaxID=3197 RepID=A0A176VHM0_MARPO|nr:hypothetical protein AXG93_909s1160 [Marchantia polymorpha subsp. ruderalis]PTQ45419.1 hypothetical protein MARPO_0015s0198 [Marchantia polymorpha]BBN01653.1 hypothetical protein Mp_2g09150 [Marchantia polymorpha subsp. ruderalis]|eukprot:PTQ45419.1 hypothetical protein MARPO_0015s0198 [Marchantia polymorpha]
MSGTSSLLVLGALLALSCCNPQLHVAADGIEGVDNVITQWNAVAQRMVRLLALPNQIAGRLFLELHVPQYRAIQLALKKKSKSPESAAHYAAHFALSELFPAQQSPIFDIFIASKISELGLSAADDREAERIGVSVAARFLKSRTNDGSQKWAKFQPAPLDGPVGKYQFTPNQTFALYPQLATTRPEVIKAAEDFDTLGGPPSIPSAKYNSDYQTLATVGNANSPLQTKLLKDTARFWEDGGNTSGIVGHLFNMSLAVTGTKISTIETAKLFTKLSVAYFDGAIAGWYQKYKYLFWRPITALRQGETTHAPLPTYDTYLRTPPHPEYPSTHSVNAGAWAAIVSRSLGVPMTQKIAPFTVATEGYLLPTRTYTSIQDPSVEIYLSRVYGGVHFPKAGKDGLQLGINVGEYVYDHFEEVYGRL